MHKRFFAQVQNNSIKTTILHLETKLQHISNTVFAHIAHVKFQKASFNSNRDMKQKAVDMATELKTIPLTVFRKWAGGKKRIWCKTINRYAKKTYMKNILRLESCSGL